jgi:hypothetical protein
MSDIAPIALFVYSRPAHTRRTLEALQADPLASRSDLVIFADGAKKDAHQDGVREVRELVRQGWSFKSVEVVERPSNFGLFGSITDGVSRLCRERGRAIVLEDDIAVVPSFLSYMNRALDRYADDTRVFQVSGYSYPGDFTASGDAYFLPMISCWGWGVWSRSWARFDPSLKGLDAIKRDRRLRRKFNIDDAYDYFGMACAQEQGRIDSWGICWQLNAFTGEGLVLYPRTSLVENHGVDASGTHGTGHADLQRPLAESDFDAASARFPERVEVDQAAFDEVKKVLRAMRPSLVHRVIDWIRT